MKTAIIAIVMFCVLIFVHELGHFIAAKACKVKVNKFALGMGPAIFKKKKGETEYSLRIFPIGGFCEMEGENGDVESKSNDKTKGELDPQVEEFMEGIDAEKEGLTLKESEDSESIAANPRSFSNKKAWQKIIILAAGAIMNGITALILMVVILFNIGQPTTTVSNVLEDSPAAVAGIQEGDTIKSIDGMKIDEWTDISTAVNGADSKKIEVVVNRDGKNRTLSSGITTSDGNKMIGVEPKRDKSFKSAVIGAPGYTWDITKQMYGAIKQLVTGEISTKEMAGPVGIVSLVNQSAKQGMINVLYLVALLSLNLGIFNLLPFPALDGGRIVFVIIRKITGRLISDRVEAIVNLSGMMLLFGLMIYVTWNDVVRLFFN